MLNKAVVTGAAGFIGSALVSHLVRQNVPVIAVGRTVPASKPASDLNESTETVRWVEADIREPGVLNELLDESTTLFHFAGHTSVAGSVKDPLLDFECNVQAFLEVLESVRHSGARLLFPSSPAVFASGQPLPLKETADKKPTSPYGAAKLACEGYAQCYHACYGVDVRIARFFNVYGPDMTRFAIHDFWSKVRQDPVKMEILGDGDQLRDYLYIDDAVEALIAITEHGEPGHDYNVASGVPVNTLELARQIATLMGAPDIKITTSGRSFPGDIPRWYADVSKLRKLIHREPIGLIAGLKRTIDGLNARAHSVEVSSLA
jgi:UDP-glucose 4-epimerase